MRKVLVRSKRAALSITGLLVAAAVASVPAFAEDHPTLQSQIEHFIECATWMAFDPAKHDELCGPGHEYFVPQDNFHQSGPPAVSEAPASSSEPPSSSSVPPLECPLEDPPAGCPTPE